MLLDAIVLLLVGALALVLPLSSAYRSQLRRRLAADADAHVPADQEAALEARMSRRTRGTGAGILLAGVVTLVAALVWEGSDDASGALFVLSAMFVGGAAGLTVADVVWPGAVTEGPRTARATSPTASDYLPLATRAMSRTYVGIGMAALLVTVLLARSEWFDATTIARSPVPVLLVAVPALALLSGLAARRVLEAPQPARDESELYWQDAVRARTLGSLALTTPAVSLVALLVCGTVLDEAASAAATASGQVGPGWSLALLVAGYVLPFVLVLVGLLVAAVPTGSTEMQHFRDRLWDGRSTGRSARPLEA